MKPRILIVDDEQPVQYILGIFLDGEGFDIDCANDIHAASDLMSVRRYDLVFADIYIGSDNGIELLRQIREHDKNVLVVLMTGLPDVESVAEGLRLGAFDYLAKPLVRQQAIATARRAMLCKKLADENERKQANLDAIFRSASDAIILVDSDNRLVQANSVAMRTCGYTPDHYGIQLHSIESGCQGTCRPTLAAVIRDGNQRNIRRLECIKQNGLKLILNFSASPVIEGDGRISGAVAIIRDDTQLAFLEKQVTPQNGYGGIVGRDAAMQRMYTLIDALANVQTTVLINGESGTGKEMVAAALHQQGIRRDKPFVKVNCSALSENLLESELFGHVRGAFTGAVVSKIGRFQKANGGTIFLDEIGDISTVMQMRLLRVLQEQEFEQVGDSTPIKVDVRVVAATNQDLAEKVRLGTFRNDLYYRLNVVRLAIPPLRERRDDIPLLVEHFLKIFSRKFGKTYAAVSQEAMDLFMDYPWPGNVRELEHTLEYAAILCPSTVISEEDLPQDFRSACHLRPEGNPPANALQGMTLEEALVKAGGNKAKAARLLGISRCTLYNKLRSCAATAPDSVRVS